jgi:hydrogenase 3 maturation protease
VGPFVCRQLRGKVSAKLIDAGTVPENHIQPIVKAGPEKLLVVDAMDFGAEPGAMRLIDAGDLSSAVMSTHSLSPRLFVDLIRKEIEVDVCFLGIQPGQMELGQPISASVAAAAERLCDMLARILPANC